MNGGVSFLCLRLQNYLVQMDNANVNKVTIVVCPLLSLMVSGPGFFAYPSNIE